MLALPADEGAEARWSVDRIQVLVFGVQVALARTLMDWGLVPDAVIGQPGRGGGCVVSGALSLDDGARVIVTRSLACRPVPERVPWRSSILLDEAAPLIARFAEVSVAVHLSSRELVLSGANAAMDAALAELEAAGRRCQRVAWINASHCAKWIRCFSI